MDSILSINYPLKSNADLKLIQEISENFITNLVKFLDIIPALMK